MSIRTARLTTRFAVRAARRFPDLVDLVKLTETDDGRGGWTDVPTTMASSVPCAIRPLRFPIPQIVASGPSVVLTHKITMPSTVATEGIDIRYHLVIHARDNSPQQTYELPVKLESSKPVLNLAIKVKNP